MRAGGFQWKYSLLRLLSIKRIKLDLNKFMENVGQNVKKCFSINFVSIFWIILIRNRIIVHIPCRSIIEKIKIVTKVRKARYQPRENTDICSKL